MGDTDEYLTNVENYSNSSQPPDLLPSPQLANEVLIYNRIFNGYLSPLVVLLTVITNGLVCLVLLKPHMRSPTNAVLVAMALSDTLTGLFPTPGNIYFFMFEKYKEYIPFELCYAYFSMTGGLPTIFHTASIWLTVALAVQRYIYVCHTLSARKWCTTQNVVIGTVFIYIISTICHLGNFLDHYYVPVEHQSALDNTSTIITCDHRTNPFIDQNSAVFYNVYYWFRIIFIHLVPCFSLIILNALLIKTMRDAKRRRMQLLRQNKKSECKKIQDSNCTTLMLVAVVGVFLVVELPSGCFIVVLVVGKIEERLEKLLTLFFNFCILVSYPVNFFIYAGMSRQFRDTFKQLFTKAPPSLNREHSKYMSLAAENGRTIVTTETNI